jgi:hypothetical protein
MGMNKLDTLIRITLLRYPTLYATRWDVLSNLYLSFGGGYQWSGGELQNIFDGEDETAARAGFFRDIEDDEAEHAKDVARGVPDCLVDLFHNRELNFGLRRKRRQFQLDNIDLITREDRLYLSGPRSNPHGLVRTISRAYSPIFLVPADAEESFSEGAREVFQIVIPMLYDLERCGHDYGYRQALIDAEGRIFPRRPGAEALAQRLVEEIIAAEKGEQAVPE